MFTEETVGSLVGALRPLPPSDAAEEPETLEVLRVQESESARAALESDGARSGTNVLLSRTQRAGLACLAAPEICVKRRASDAQFGEQPSQRK